MRDGKRGAADDFAFIRQLAEQSGRPLLFNAITINDEFPESFRSQLRWLDETNARGIRVFGQASSEWVPGTVTFGLEDGRSADFRAVDVRQSFTGSSFTAITPVGNPSAVVASGSFASVPVAWNFTVNGTPMIVSSDSR